MSSIKTKVMKVASCSIIGVFIASSLGTQAFADSNESSEAPGLDSEDTAFAYRMDIHPQDPNYPGVHVASLEEAANGDILYSFYGGTAEGEDDVATYMSRLPNGSKTWEAPEVAFDEVGKPDGNAVLWNDDNDKLHLFATTITGSGWTQAILRQVISEDNGHTWSQPKMMREEWGWVFGTKPIKMSNGETILPFYSEAEWSSGFMVSDDNFETWDVYPSEDDTEWPTSPNGAIQPNVVELDDHPGHLMAYMRTKDNYIYKTESENYGRTWTDAEPTDLPNNNSRIALIKLNDGNLLLAYNPVGADGSRARTPLSLAISEDEGKTWSEPVNVESDPEEESGAGFPYPYLLQADDGTIHLAYTHRRKTMRHVAFNEDFVRSGEDLTSNPEFSIREYKNGEQQDVDEPDYVSLSSLDRIKDIVDLYKEKNDGLSDAAVKKLKMKLDAISYFEENENVEKVIKHLEGFKKLTNALAMEEGARDTLQEKAGSLIKRWEQREGN